MSSRRRLRRRIAGPLLAAALTAAGAEARVLHVAAGASPGGDGSAAAPFASLAAAQAGSAAGDWLVVHGGGTALGGGIVLQPGQTLIGAPAEAGTADGPAPRIAGGAGPAVVLADGCRVIGLEVVGGSGAGLLGVGVDGVRLEDLRVTASGGAAIELSGEVAVDLLRVAVERPAGAGILGRDLAGRLAIADSTIDEAASGGVMLVASGSFELTLASSRVSGAGAGSGDGHGLAVTAGDGAAAAVDILGSRIEGSAGNGVSIAAPGSAAAVRFSLAGSAVAASGGYGVALVAQGGEEPARIDFELRGGLDGGGGITGSRSSAVSVQADGAAQVTGMIAGTSIEGAELGRGIEVLADDASRVVVRLDGNRISRTEHQGIYADAQDEARLDLTLTDNLLSAPRAASYGLEINVRERAQACLAALRNQSAAPSGGSGLRARQRDGSALRVEASGSAAAAAVGRSLEAGNAGTSVVVAAAAGLEAVPEGTCLLP